MFLAGLNSDKLHYSIEESEHKGYKKISFFDPALHQSRKRELKICPISDIIKAAQRGEKIHFEDCFIDQFSLEEIKSDDEPLVLKDVCFKNSFFNTARETDFQNIIFEGEQTNFENVVFSHGGVNFNNCTFNTKEVLFKRAKFGIGEKNFQFSEFNCDLVSFAESFFNDGEVSFVNTRFLNADISFRNAVFGKGIIDFKFTYFNAKRLIFEKATLGEGKVDFKNSEFNLDKVDFRRVAFNDGDVIFEGTEFQTPKILFRNSSFGAGKVNFELVYFGNAKVQFDHVDFGSGVVTFKNAKGKSLSMKGCSLNLFVDLRVNSFDHIDLSHSIIRDIVDFDAASQKKHLKILNIQGIRVLGKIFIDWKNNNVKEIIYNQENTSANEKSHQFRILKENFRSNGQYDDEDLAYLEFKRTEEKAQLKEALKEPFFSRMSSYISYFFRRIFFDQIGHYGTNPVRVLFHVILFIFGFSLVYFTFSYFQDLNAVGHIVASGNETLPLNSGNLTVLEAYGNSLYFSGITFFTVGYGDYYVQGILKPFAIFEGFCGVFLMSYFTVAFVRKILR